MQKMGYGEQPYIVFRHKDISREHLHLVFAADDPERRSSGNTRGGEFKRLLKADNIDTVFRINPVGRIYGVMFIDHNAGIVANGSVLGREFSAHVFNELFPVSENAERHAMDQHQEQKHEQRSHTANPVSGAVGTLLDLADARAVEEQQRIQRRRKRRL